MALIQSVITEADVAEDVGVHMLEMATSICDLLVTRSAMASCTCVSLHACHASSMIMSIRLVTKVAAQQYTRRLAAASDVQGHHNVVQEVSNEDHHLPVLIEGTCRPKVTFL
jgi:hypothetical protein